MAKHIIYSILKIYIRIGLHVYFKRYQRMGKQNIPDGPLLFVSNHQNAFLDALVITCASNRNPYFLARASIFKKKWTVWLLSIIRILPIYRIRDGYGSLKKNNTVFNRCSNLLASGKSILIFPEGDHGSRFYLRPLQKGAARIAFHSVPQSQDDISLNIIPVGVQYEHYDRPGSSVLVSFGNPLNIQDYMADYGKDPANAIEKLTDDIATSIRKLMIDIQPQDRYDEIKQQWQASRSLFPDLKQRLVNDQELLALIQSHQPLMNINVIKKASVSPGSILHWVFYIFAKINMVIPDQIISYLVKFKLPEPQFEGSMRFVLWAIPGSLFLLLQSVALFIIWGNPLYPVLYLILTLGIARVALYTRAELPV